MTSAPTDTFAFCTHLVPGREEEYERFHRTVPAELKSVMRAAGVLNWRIHRNGTTLTHFVEARSREFMRAYLDSDPVNVRWQQQVAPFLAAHGDRQPAAEPGRLIWDFSWPTL